MKTAVDVVELTKQYVTGLTQMEERRKQWHESVGMLVKNSLEDLSIQIKENNTFFANNVFVENEFLEPGFYIRSGSIPLPTEDPLYPMEEGGFEVHFILTSGGRIEVVAKRHSFFDRNENEVIDLIDEPILLTKERIVDLVYRGIQRTIRTSFLFEGD